MRHHLADDAAQEAAIFVARAWGELPTTQPARDGILRWWARFGVLVVVGRERARRRTEDRARMLGAHPPLVYLHPSLVPTSGRLEHLRHALSRLPPPLHDAAWTWAELGSVHGAARELGVNVHTVISRQRTAFDRVRAEVRRRELRDERWFN